MHVIQASSEPSLCTYG